MTVFTSLSVRGLMELPCQTFPQLSRIIVELPLLSSWIEPPTVSCTAVLTE
jgi:hypothetical protein